MPEAGWRRRQAEVGGVRAFRIGGTPQDATPFVPPEYHPYFDETGGGGVITTLESGPDPSCVAMADTDEERDAVYANQPDFGDCVPPGGKIRKRKVGRARLGARREKVVAKVGPPKRSDTGRDAWCVIGGGSMSVHYVDDEASLIRTTTPGHSIRGVGPGDRGAALEKAGFEEAGRRRGRTRVHELRGRRRQLFAGVRGGVVRWIEVARFIR